jgi:hypothetical protein
MLGVRIVDCLVKIEVIDRSFISIHTKLLVMRATSLLVSPPQSWKSLHKRPSDFAPYQTLAGEWPALGRLGSIRCGMDQATGALTFLFEASIYVSIIIDT